MKLSDRGAEQEERSVKVKEEEPLRELGPWPPPPQGDAEFVARGEKRRNLGFVNLHLYDIDLFANRMRGARLSSMDGLWHPKSTAQDVIEHCPGRCILRYLIQS